jgi:hypothetical protein
LGLLPLEVAIVVVTLVFLVMLGNIVMKLVNQRIKLALGVTSVYQEPPLRRHTIQIVRLLTAISVLRVLIVRKGLLLNCRVILANINLTRVEMNVFLVHWAFTVRRLGLRPPLSALLVFIVQKVRILRLDVQLEPIVM